MDLAHRISAAKFTEATSDLQENKLIPIIGAKRFFGNQVILLFQKHNGAGMLCLNKEISDILTEQDVTDIDSHKYHLFLLYKKHNCGCNNCHYFEIVSA
jgi:hypothetical protein